MAISSPTASLAAAQSFHDTDFLERNSLLRAHKYATHEGCPSICCMAALTMDVSLPLLARFRTTSVSCDTSPAFSVSLGESSNSATAAVAPVSNNFGAFGHQGCVAVVHLNVIARVGSLPRKRAYRD
jgi:hypothetical protein